MLLGCWGNWSFDFCYLVGYVAVGVRHVDLWSGLYISEEKKRDRLSSVFCACKFLNSCLAVVRCLISSVFSPVRSLISSVFSSAVAVPLGRR